MSRPIKITENEISQMKKEFLDALNTAKLADGKFTFSKTFESKDRKASLLFTEKAWIKQSALVDKFDKEIAWHGVARRGDDTEADEYIIDDIIVYPQEVTGATVTTDQEKYQNWLYEQEDDVFNNIRMQGHSHVNMSVTPSGVDDSIYERILGQLEDDMFYIFLIWNKKGDKTIKIYDLAKNVLFETKDVEVGIVDPVIDLDDFLEEANEQVVTKTYQPARTYGYTGKSVVQQESQKSGKSAIWNRKGRGKSNSYYGYGTEYWY